MVRPTRRNSRSGRIGLLIATARVTAGAAFIAAPVGCARVLGMDSATASRASWLARMAGSRDLVLGAGTIGSLRRGTGTGWLLAGAAVDLADAAVLAQALRQQRLRGLPAVGAVAVAGAAGAAAGWVAVTGRRAG